MDFAIEPLAEDALLLRFGDAIDATLNARVHGAARAIRAANLPGIVDVAPAYATLLVRFDSRFRGVDALPEAITKVLHDAFSRDHASGATTLAGSPAQHAEIPVCYGGGFGPDLDAIAQRAGATPGEVAARHAAAEYTVAMLGFAPGFAYLLGMDPALHAPRRAHPRTRVPAGSVAIGGAQTGIYPRELPGGWNLIGRTPLALFDPDREPPCLLAPGDRVRFRAISEDEFRRLAERGA
jgi:KipI family sensor histidine kinase inhibitor